MGSTDDPILVWDLWKNQRKKAPRPPYHRRGQPDLEKAKVRFVPYPNVVRFPKTYFYKSFEIWRSGGVHTLAVWNPLYLLCVAPFSVVQCNFCALHISLLHLLSVASLFDASFGRCIFLISNLLSWTYLWVATMPSWTSIRMRTKACAKPCSGTLIKFHLNFVECFCFHKFYGLNLTWSSKLTPPR